jgi:hypothetical protein
VNGYQFALTCPSCGSGLEPQREGQPSGWSTCAIALCSECRSEFTVTVTVLLNRRRPKMTEARLAQLERARGMRVYA